MAFQTAPFGAQAAADSTAGPSGFVLPLGPDTQVKILLSIAIVVVLVVARRLLLSFVERRVDDGAVVYRWAKISGYTTFVLGLLGIAQVWFTAIRSLGTFLGLLTAGLAIALKDIVAGVAGWVFILWRKPFELGDRIQIGAQAGDVVDIRLFQFTLMEIGNWVGADQSTGRMIHVPNAKVFTEPLANYTAGFPYLWNELPITVTFESDWRKAKSILEAIASSEAGGVSHEAERSRKQTAKRFLIHYAKLTPAVYTSVQDSGVMLTIRYLCRPRERRGTAQAMWERVLPAFAEHPDITLAYPTQRVMVDHEAGRPDRA